MYDGINVIFAVQDFCKIRRAQSVNKAPICSTKSLLTGLITSDGVNGTY